MANLLLPYDAYELVKQLKEKVKVPIQLHTHNTSGTGDMVLMKAIEAGVDIVDTALSPLGNGTSQPATEPLVATLKDTQYDTGLDLQQLSEIAVHFRKVADRLKADGFLDPKVLSVDINTLLYQVPGGMLSNLLSQLKPVSYTHLDVYKRQLLGTTDEFLRHFGLERIEDLPGRDEWRLPPEQEQIHLEDTASSEAALDLETEDEDTES